MELKKKFKSEVYPMSGGWYYIIRDPNQNYKMIYSSEIFRTKKIAETYARRRKGLYNVQVDLYNEELKEADRRG